MGAPVRSYMLNMPKSGPALNTCVSWTEYTMGRTYTPWTCRRIVTWLHLNKFSINFYETLKVVSLGSCAAACKIFFRFSYSLLLIISLACCVISGSRRCYVYHWKWRLIKTTKLWSNFKGTIKIIASGNFLKNSY